MALSHSHLGLEMPVPTVSKSLTHFLLWYNGDTMIKWEVLFDAQGIKTVMKCLPVPTTKEASVKATDMMMIWLLINLGDNFIFINHGFVIINTDLTVGALIIYRGCF